MPLTERDEQIEVFSNGIDALLVIRKQLAENRTPEPMILDATMGRIGRAFSLCWDLRHNKKLGG